jgi:tetratricopeptide (TPR) repeat protein
MKKLYLLLVILSMAFSGCQTEEQYLNRGNAKAKFQNYTGAITDYTKALELNPKFAGAYYNRGIAKSDLQNFTGAIDDYTKAIEINPKHEHAYIN